LTHLGLRDAGSGEWIRTGLGAGGTKYFDLLLLGSAAAAVSAAREGRWSAGDLLMLLPMAAAGVLFSRDTVPFAIASAPVVASTATEWCASTPPRVSEIVRGSRWAVVGPVTGLVLLILLFGFEVRKARRDAWVRKPLGSASLPVGAAALLARG